MKQKMTRWQKVGFCAAALLPTIWLLLGLLMVLGGSVFTLSFILAHLLLPAAESDHALRLFPHTRTSASDPVLLFCLGHYQIQDASAAFP